MNQTEVYIQDGNKSMKTGIFVGENGSNYLIKTSRGVENVKKWKVITKEKYDREKNQKL